MPLFQPNRAPHVRRWKRGDLAAIREVAWETWVSAYGTFIPEEDMRNFHNTYYTLPRLLSLFQSGIVDGWVALADGATVGYSKSHWNAEKNEFFITSLYVLPTHQKTGLGKRLLQAGMNKAREHGCDRVWLGVMAENQPAIDWYNRQGFLFVDSTPFTIGNTTVEDLIGYKLISGA